MNRSSADLRIRKTQVRKEWMISPVNKTQECVGVYKSVQKCVTLLDVMTGLHYILSDCTVIIQYNRRSEFILINQCLLDVTHEVTDSQM